MESGDQKVQYILKTKPFPKIDTLEQPSLKIEPSQVLPRDDQKQLDPESARRAAIANGKLAAGKKVPTAAPEKEGRHARAERGNFTASKSNCSPGKVSRVYCQETKLDCMVLLLEPSRAAAAVAHRSFNRPRHQSLPFLLPI